MLKSLGKRRERFSGLQPWSYFAQTSSNELPNGLRVAQMKYSSVLLAGEVSNQQLEHSHAPCKETAWREMWIPNAGWGPPHTRTSAGVVYAAVFQMGECQLSLQGVLVWYLTNVLEGRFAF